MVELSSRLRGLLGERTDLPMASLYLRADGPGCCLHGPVAGYDWDGAARAHGALDLMTLRFDLARRARDLGRWVGAGLRESAPRCQG